MKIIKINGSQIILVDCHGKQHRRNSSHVKKYLKKNPATSTDEEDSITTDPITPHETQPATPTPLIIDTNPQVQEETNNNQPEAEATRRSNRQRTAPKYLGLISKNN